MSEGTNFQEKGELVDFLTLLILAVGLAMDAFAVSISNGMCYRYAPKKYGVYTAVAFGFAQGLMPLLGYLAGQTFSGAIQSMDHWIALCLLCIIGGKMIYEAFHEEEDGPVCERPFGLRMLVMQAIATSIDALAVGISFAVMGVNIVYASGVIAFITFLCCVVGYGVGIRFGGMLKQKAAIFGGTILILIGVKIFLEHTLKL